MERIFFGDKTKIEKFIKKYFFRKTFLFLLQKFTCAKKPNLEKCNLFNTYLLLVLLCNF